MTKQAAMVRVAKGTAAPVRAVYALLVAAGYPVQLQDAVGGWLAICAPARSARKVQAAIKAAQERKPVAPARRPPKQYDMNGVCGLVAQYKRPDTGLVYSIYEAVQAALDPDGGKWVLVCEAHKYLVNTDSIHVARAELPHGDWCDKCNGNAGEGTGWGDNREDDEGTQA